MEQNLGSVGKVVESYSKGVATVAGQASLPPTEFGLSFSVELKADLDAKILVEFLAKKIGGPVPEEIAKFIEMALAAT